MSRLVGVDIGGTFTDFFVWDGQALGVHKRPSTPADFAQAVGAGLEHLGGQAGFRLIQGSTVATNALLERRGRRTALIATEGFKDILRIGRQHRPQLYDLHVRRPAPIIEPADCFEVGERIAANGSVVTELDEGQARQVLERIRQQGVDNVAVCLLFSFLNPVHEQAVGRLARELGLCACLSSDLLPEVREFERASTTAINAFVGPVMTDYLLRLDRTVNERGSRDLSIMQSNGGQTSPALAAAEAVRTLLSGPAGGVIAARHVARSLGLDRIVTYDMGGTSTDVCVCDREPEVTTTWDIDGWPVRVPMLDIHTVGAGGGSIARLDAGGALRVGPQSAGADPGPACYGRSLLPTVTDANLILGRIVPEYFLGGRMSLDLERAEKAMHDLAAAFGQDVREIALSIVLVVEAAMQRAIKHVSARRGHDPAGFWLLGFGGAGGLHACRLAEGLGMPGVIVPQHAGVLSAAGMVLADRVKDFSVSLPAGPGTTPDLGELRRRYAELMEKAALVTQLDGYEQDDCVLDRFADMRYRGQSHEITVPVDFLTDEGRLLEPFHAAHQRLYGLRLDDRPVEIVTLRLRSTIAMPKPPAGGLATCWPALPDAGGLAEDALIGRRRVILDRPGEVPVLDRWRLPARSMVAGPALIVEAHATTLLPDGWTARVQDQGHLIVTHQGAEPP